MTEFDPKRLVEVVGEAEAAHREGLLDKAEELYQKALVFERDAFRSPALKGPDGVQVKTFLNTTFSRIYNNLASIRAGEENYREAADLLRTALDYTPGSTEILTNAARINRLLGNFEKALALSREVLEDQPGHVAAAIQFAKAALETGELSEAIERCERVGAKGSANHRFLVAWGQLLNQAERREDAKEKFLAAHEKNREAPFPLVMAGSASMHLGQYEQAIGYFTRSLKRDPANLLAHSSLAALFLRLNRYQRAEKHLKAALRIDPAHPETNSNYAAFLLRRGHFKEAARLAGQVMEAEGVWDPVRISAGVTLSKSLRYLGRIEDAGKHLERLARLVPAALDDAAFHKERGFTLEAEGKYSEAFREYTKGNALGARMASSPPEKFGFDHLIENTLEQDFYKFTFEGTREAPVFIVGFPAGGAQILGAMLSTFPQVNVLEESNAVNGIRVRLIKEGEPYPAVLNLLSKAVVGDLRTYYQQLFAEHDGADPEKLNINANPLNLLDVPLVLKMYPGARFIYTYNHPFDAALNCFLMNPPPTQLAHKFSDLAEIGVFYARCAELWEKFKKELPLEFHEVRGEDLLKNPKKVLAPVLGFIDPEGRHNLSSAREGLARLEETAEAQKALHPPGRWRHYAEQLDPLAKKLNPVCKKLGYPVE